MSMKWIDSALFPLQKEHWKASLIVPSLFFLGYLLFIGVVCGGFLSIVGINPPSILMALIPMMLALLLTLFLTTGYCWRVLGSFTSKKDQMCLLNVSCWPQLLLEGFELVLFYGVLVAFLVSATAVFYPIGCIIPLLILLYYPMFTLPILLSTQDRTFLGLLDGCVEAVKMAKQPQYFSIWCQLTGYVLIFSVLVYPIMAFSFSLTGIGVLFLPGLACVSLLGYYVLLHNLYQKHGCSLPSQRCSSTLENELSATTSPSVEFGFSGASLYEPKQPRQNINKYFGRSI